MPLRGKNRGGLRKKGGGEGERWRGGEREGGGKWDTNIPTPFFIR